MYKAQKMERLNVLSFDFKKRIVYNEKKDKKDVKYGESKIRVNRNYCE